MTDHDRLFKELLSTFLMEFLELFFPDLASTIEPESIRFLQQEYFLDLTSGDEKVIDLLVEVKQAGEDMAFLIHLEAQAFAEANFTRRIFFYFALLHQKYLQRVYPVVVFSFDQPYRQEPHQYRVEFPELMFECHLIAYVVPQELSASLAWSMGNTDTFPYDAVREQR
jgi:hypothetical protein